MDRLQTKVAKCEYIEHIRLLMEQFIGGLNNDDMTDEILLEVSHNPRKHRRSQ